MTDYLIVDGVRPFDGRYEFDLRGATFTVREWGWIKRLSGYLPLTIDDGLAGTDAELMAVFAIIALVRAGKLTPEDVPSAWERFVDAPGVVTIRLQLARRDEVDADEDPPRSSTESANDSGADGTTSLENSGENHRATGTHDSATSASLPVGGWES